MSRYIKTVSKNKTIAFHNEEEFKERLNSLIYVSGVMKVSFVELFEKKIGLLRPIDLKKEDMNFVYHCFGKTGLENEYFGDIMCATHILETLYLENQGYVIDNCQPVLYKEKYYLGWFNYLFGDKLTLHNWDKWKAYLSLKDEKGFDINDFDKTFEMNYGYYPIISNCEVLAVEYGIDELNKELSLDKYKDLYFIRGIKDIKENIKDFKENSNINKDEQIKMLIQSMNEYIAEKHDLLDENKDDIYFKDINISLMIMDSPILMSEAIAEVYDIDFWELYKQLDEYDERRFYSRELLDEPLSAISTIDLFHLDVDDMIYYWREDEDICFSDELKEWFEELQDNYKNILDKGLKIENPVKWFIDLLDYAEENYYSIMPFSASFHDTLNHITDSRYLALWKIFENMCYDENMYEAGSVIFKEEGTYDPNRQLDLFDQRRRPLKESWRFISEKEKRNPARVKLLRYLALIANNELRQIIFGI